jgi:hypothetical protein
MTTTPFDTALVSRPAETLLVPALDAGAEGTRSQGGWFTPATLALGALSLGSALQVNLGQYHPTALAWLSVAAVACVAAVVLPNFGRLTFAGWRTDQVLLVVALAVQFVMLYARDPAVTLKLSAHDDLAPFKSGVALAAALTAVGLSATRAARFAVPAMLLLHLVLGVWILRATPAPGIDVYVFQRDACDALLRGVNPYAITFPDIYDGKLDVYGPGVVINGRLQFGYPYLPLSLILALPGYLLGDFRFAQLAAMTFAGALIVYARPRRADSVGGSSIVGIGGPSARSVAAAAMLLFTPRGYFALEAGWTEPFASLMLAATVFAACRRGRGWSFACAVFFGLLLASKQYLALALPLVLLLPTPTVRGGRYTFCAIAFVIAAVVTLPLATWDLGAFIHSTVTLQFKQPFRPDALSYLVPLRETRGILAPTWIPFAAAGVATLLALWRCPRTASGFACAVALVFLAFFATNKQAFCNYYVFVLAAMCCALSAIPGIPAMKPAPAASSSDRAGK